MEGTTTTTENTKEMVEVGVAEWETKAKAWLSNLPKDETLSQTQVQSWVNSNLSSLPDPLKSLSESDLYHRFTLLHSSLQSHSSLQEVKHVTRGENPARFQRTELWRPVYSWLESIDLDDVISSNEISDWLGANPEIYDQLLSKHTRHHLMHYIKKCHIKILKKTKGKQFKPNLSTYRSMKHLDVPNHSSPISSNPMQNVPKDSDLYRVKRDEALRKFEILVELEAKLSEIISNRNAAGNSKDS